MDEEAEKGKSKEVNKIETRKKKNHDNDTYDD